MKKTLLFVAIIASVFCLSANKLINSAALVVLDPELPETAFDYELEIPQHVINDATGSFGIVDGTQILEIDDDIATLGRVLFYDELLSASQNIACATCHLQSKSFADEFAVSEGVNIDTRRNSLQLNDLGWTNRSGFFWDMRKLELAEIIDIPLTDGNEIGASSFEEIADRLLTSDYYPDLFEKAYGDAVDITKEKVIDALVHFISSITSFDSKFDRVLKGEETFTPQELRGFDHFNSMCRECHTPATYYDMGNAPLFEIFPFFFANGQQETNDLGIGEFYPGFEHLFKLPTLRNIELTGPYMHDGSMETLEDVVKHYSEDAVDDGWGFVPPGGFGFNDDEQAEIVAFLKTFTDHSMTAEEKWSDPFEVSVSTDPIDLESLDISIYPNPASDFVNVEFSNPSKQMLHAALLSSSGQLMQKSSTHGSEINVNLRNIPSGMYLLQLRNGDQQATKKIMVEK